MAVLLRLVLILVVMAGSVVMAPARGMSASVMQITICSEGGTETLALDAQGNPVAPHHPCPDCLPGLSIGPIPGVAAPQPTRMSRPLSLSLPRRIEAAGLATLNPSARDPPLSI